MAKIIGNTTATTMAVPDWNQQDSTKADYIKNKPTVLTEAEVVQLINDNSIQEVEDGAVSYEKLHEDLARQLVGENTFFGHKGYYITAINTQEKWVTLTDSATKPNYPEIGTDTIDQTRMKAPYAGVYQVQSDKATTLTNETGHTVTLEEGEIKYFYLIKGYNNLTLSDETATITFTELEGNGMEYISEVDVSTTPLTSVEKETLSVSKNLASGGTTTITTHVEQAGLYYLQIQFWDSNMNLISVETDTGFCGTIQQYQYGWNILEKGAGTTDLLIVYLREGKNTFTITNCGSSTSYINAIAICNTEEYNDPLYPQYAAQLSIGGCNVTPSYKSVVWVGAAQNQTGYFNGYAGGTDTDNELKPGDSVEITVENLPYTGVYAFQLFIESITGGDTANVRVMTADGYYSDCELTEVDLWTNRMNPPKDIPIYMNEGDNTVHIINIGTSTVKLDDTDCGRLDAAGAAKSLDFLDMIQTNFPKENSFQYKRDNYDLGYAVGDEFSMVNGAHYDFCGVITNIEGKKVYYEEDLPFNKVDKATNDFDDHIFFVPSKPNAGAVQIVTIAFATGIDTKAAGKSSFGGGRNNVAGGDYSFVAGRNNLASYCAAALGLNTQAKGRYTFSAGYFAKALGEYSVAINNYTIAEGENAFAHGYGTLANGDSMVAGGKCNKTEDGVIVVYGNGDSWDARRDAYILDWNGNGWYRGGLKLGGDSPYEAEDVLVRSQILALIRQNSNNIDLSNYYNRTQVESLIDTKISNAITSLIGGSY